MVKKIALFFAYSIFFILALMYFTPKSSIYYLLETELKKHDAILSFEEVVDSGFSLKIKHANLSVKSMSSANIDEATIKIFAIYNSINIEEITLSSTAKPFVPLRVQSADIVYSIFSPLNIYAHSVGEFGEVDAIVNILDNSLHLELKPSKLMLKEFKNTLQNLEKTENREFVYDKTF